MKNCFTFVINDMVFLNIWTDCLLWLLLVHLAIWSAFNVQCLLALHCSLCVIFVCQNLLFLNNGLSKWLMMWILFLISWYFAFFFCLSLLKLLHTKVLFGWRPRLKVYEKKRKITEKFFLTQCLRPVVRKFLKFYFHFP